MKNNWIEKHQKKWLELLTKSWWDNFRINTEINNKNTKLWKQLRRGKNNY
jgi:hypothetical protein